MVQRHERERIPKSCCKDDTVDTRYNLFIRVSIYIIEIKEIKTALQFRLRARYDIVKGSLQKNSSGSALSQGRQLYFEGDGEEKYSVENEARMLQK